MLRFMRAAANTIIAKILLLLLVGSFLVWGIADFIREKPDTILASIGDSKLSVAEYQQTLTTDLQRINASLGQNLTLQQATAFGLPARILSRVLAEKTLDTDVKRFNIALSERETVNSVLQDKQFTNEAGQFSRSQYDQMLRTLGLNEERFIKQRNSQLRRQIFADAYLAGLEPPKMLQAVLASGVYEERKIATLTVPLSSIPMPELPPISTLRKYYETTKDRWKAPEFRNVLMLIHTPRQEIIDVAILKAEYEATKASLIVPEHRKIFQLIFPDIKAAEEFNGKLKTTTFEKLAEAKGDDADVYDLGSVTQQDLSDEAVRKIAFSLKKGESALIPNGKFGPAVIKIDDISAGKTPNFEDAKQGIIAKLSKAKQEEASEKLEKKIDEALANGIPFEDISKQHGVQFVNVKSVNRAGMNTKGAAVPYFSGKEELLKATFEATEGFEITPIKFSDGAIVWVNVAKVTPAALQKYEMIEAQVYQNWAAQEQFNVMEAKAKALADEANKGANLKALAARENLKLTEISYFSRQTAPKNLTSVAISEIYSTAPKKFGTYFEDANQSMNVFQVIDARIPARAKDGLPKEEIAKLTQGYQDDLFGIYVLARQNAMGLNLNEKLLNGILNTPAAGAVN